MQTNLWGKIMTVHAIILLPSCLIPDFLGYFLLLWIAPMLLFIPIGIRYASTRLEMEGARAKISSSKEIKPIELGFLWKISPVVLYIILLAYMILTYPSLPDIIAVHFDSHGNPNGWSTKQDFFLWYSLLSTLFPALAYTFIYLGERHPIFVHPGKMRFPRDAYVKMITLAMDCSEVLMLIVYYTIYLYAVKNVLLPMSYTLISVALIMSIPLLYLLLRWKK